MDLSMLKPRGKVPLGTPVLDNLSIVYIVLNVFWTAVILVASLALWYLRRHESIGKRNVGLTIATALCLQVYWSLNMIVYPLHGAYPCDLNYWMMSIYFPLGIALFQLQNVQLLSVSARQRELREDPFKRSNGVTLRHFRFWKYSQSWTNTTFLSRMYFGISIFIILQIIFSLSVFFVSRKFVSFGVAGHPIDGPEHCTHGWEWVTTILYQAIWTYVFGPWLLWRIRKINDIFHWRLQTVLAILFSLPGLPMWIISTEIPAWAPVTAKFPNGCWYNPGICVMQSVALFVPLYEVLRANSSRTKSESGSEKPVQGSRDADLESQIRQSKHSVRAFEEALQNTPDELFEYACTREFTGENIVFLNNVRKFKRNWSSSWTKGEPASVEHKQKSFSIATDIFDRYVSLETAQFAINIEGSTYQKLVDMFGRDVVPSTSAITPFADRWSVATIAALVRTSDKYTTNNKPVRPSLVPDASSVTGYEGSTSSEFILSTKANCVPEGFDISIFDDAERSIKDLVFTSTWVRYVESWRHSQSTLSRASHGSWDPVKKSASKGESL